MSLHKIEATYADGRDDLRLRIIHCPQDDTCAVYHECREPGCDVEEWQDDYEFTAHGVRHLNLENGAFVKDEPHNCGLYYAVDWEELDTAVAQHGPGIYECRAEYDDYYWFAVEFKKVKW